MSSLLLNKKEHYWPFRYVILTTNNNILMVRYTSLGDSYELNGLFFSKL